MLVSKEAGSDVLKLGEVFHKDLLVQLTTEEIAAKASEMATAQMKLMRLEEIKKRWMKRIGDKMKPLKASVEHLATVIDSGEELQPVRVQWEQELGTMNQVLRRLDTQELISESRQAMPPQAVLDFIAPPEEGGSPVEDVEAEPQSRPERTPAEPEPERRTTADYRKVPANANRGTHLCEEGKHEYGPPDAEGWQPCRKCPEDMRPVAKQAPAGEDEPDLDESQAALEEMEASAEGSTRKVPVEIRWPLSAGAEAWQLSINGDDIYLHSPDLPGSPTRAHGPAGWVPTGSEHLRIVPWGHAKVWDVPPAVLSTAAELLASPPEGMPRVRTMSEVRAEIAAQRAEAVREIGTGEIPFGNEPQPSKPGATSTETEAGEPAATDGGSAPAGGEDLTALDKASLVALLDGPLTPDQLRAKARTHRPGATLKRLQLRGMVGAPRDDEKPAPPGEYFALTPSGRTVAERLKRAKDGGGQ